MRKENLALKKMVISAMFLAGAVVLNRLSAFYVTNSLKISFAGALTLFPAILFGPIYGAVVGGLTDLIGYVLQPVGDFIPLLTLTAMLGGALQGFLWKFLKKVDGKTLRFILAGAFALVGIYGIISHIALNVDGIMNGIIALDKNMPTKEASQVLLGGDNLSFPTKVVFQFAQFTKPDNYAAELALYANLMSVGFEVLALSGLGITFIRFKKSAAYTGKKITPFTFTAVMLIAGLIITTINTFILMIYIPSLAQRAFLLLWIPRIIKEVFTCAVQSYLAAALYVVYINTVEKRLGRGDGIGL